MKQSEARENEHLTCLSECTNLPKPAASKARRRVRANQSAARVELPSGQISGRVSSESSSLTRLLLYQTSTGGLVGVSQRFVFTSEALTRLGKLGAIWVKRVATSRLPTIAACVPLLETKHGRWRTCTDMLRNAVGELGTCAHRNVAMSTLCDKEKAWSARRTSSGFI